MLPREQYEALVRSSADAEMSWQKTWGLIHRAGVPRGESSHYYALWHQLRYGSGPYVGNPADNRERGS